LFDARAAGVAQIVGSVIGGAGRADAVSSCARGCSPGRLCPWRPRRPRWPNRSTIEWYDARELLCSRNRGFVRATAALFAQPRRTCLAPPRAAASPGPHLAT